MAKQSLSTIEYKLETFFAKLPQFPTDVKDLIVKYGPYVVLVGGVVTLLSTLQSFFSGLRSPDIFVFNNYLFLVFNAVVGLALIASFKPLLNRQMRGWRTLFYINILDIVILVISFVLFPAFYIFGFAAPLIAFFLLFQVKSHYS